MILYSLVLYLFIIIIGSLSRLITGPWYHITNPMSILILDGYPASWEAHLFAPRYELFTSNIHHSLDFTEVQLRALIPLGLGSLVAAWTREGYWSTAIVEIVGWVLAARGCEHIAVTLGFQRRVAVMTGLLVASSPLFVSQLWMQVFHLAEFSSMVFGIIIVHGLAPDLENSAKKLFVNEKAFFIVGKLTLMLWILSHMYVYQSITLAYLMLTTQINIMMLNKNIFSKFLSFLYIGCICIVSYGGYLLIDNYMLKYLTNQEVNIRITGIEISGNPLTLLQANLGSVEKIDTFNRLLLIIFNKFIKILALMINSYHLVVISIIAIGLVSVPNSIRLRIVVLEMLALVASALYHTPWTSMTGYPLMYIAAAYGCDRISRSAACTINDITRSVLGPRPAYIVCMISTMLIMIGATNRDIFGYDEFMREWWRLYSETFPS